VSDRNVPAADFAVVLVPPDPAAWTPLSRSIAAGRPNQEGEFRIVGLPPGRYLAAALEYLAVGEEHDPDLLRQLRDRATPLTLVAGEPATITLTIAP
jgi:hypothetical protein